MRHDTRVCAAIFTVCSNPIQSYKSFLHSNQNHKLAIQFIRLSAQRLRMISSVSGWELRSAAEADLRCIQYCLKQTQFDGVKRRRTAEARHSRIEPDGRSSLRRGSALPTHDRLLQAVDVDLAPRIRNRRQVGACRDIHFPICDHRRAEFDSVSRRVAAVRGAAIELSRIIRRVIRDERGAGWRSFGLHSAADSPR